MAAEPSSGAALGHASAPFRLPSPADLAAFHSAHFQQSTPQIQPNFNYCNDCADWRIIVGHWDDFCSVCGGQNVTWGEEEEQVEVKGQRNGAGVKFDLTPEVIAMFRHSAEWKKQREIERALEEEEERRKAEQELLAEAALEAEAKKKDMESKEEDRH